MGGVPDASGSDISDSAGSSDNGATSSSGSSGSSSSGSNGSSGGSDSASSNSSGGSGSGSGSSSGSNGSSDGGGDGGSDAHGDSGASDAASDASPLSFATDVYPIITSRCIACHNPAGAGVTMGRLDFTTNLAAGAFNQLMLRAMGNVIGSAATTCMASGLFRVVPGSAATSVLFNKVDSKLMNVPPLCGNPMPAPTLALPLTPAQVITIANWIDQGANP